MMRPVVRLSSGVLALAALAGAAACGSSSTAPDTVPPPVPAITSPTEGSIFSNFPRVVTVTWNAVTDDSSNPVTYRVDVQALITTGNGIEDLTDEGSAGTCNGTVTGTTCTFTFPGMNPGRIRIQAVDKAGNVSAFSAFVDFTYTV